MHILMISDVYFPRVNGVSTSIRTFRRELIALGHRVTLIAPEYPQACDDDSDMIRVPSRGVPLDPEDRMMIRAHVNQLFLRLRDYRIDIVHINTPFVAHYAGLYLAKHLDVPVIETYHTFFEEYLHHYVPYVPRALTRFLARRFTVSQCNSVHRIVSPSRAMQQALVAYGVRTPIEILPTGLEQSQFRAGDGIKFRTKHGIPPARPVLLYVGRVAHEKNIDFLVTMFKFVKMRVPETLLLIVGEGPAQAHLQSLTARLQLTSAVKFIGYLDRDSELLDCYAAGDLFVFASRTETQGLVLLEALAQGTPVVSTIHMGTRDVLEHARGARTVEEDLDQFANAVVELLQDTAARERLSLLAPEDAGKWTAREMADRLVRCYEAAITSRQRSLDIVPQESA